MFFCGLFFPTKANPYHTATSLLSRESGGAVFVGNFLKKVSHTLQKLSLRVSF
jgi:hypothetical protein